MKAMVCEMCSSHELVKQDGMYVCQHCGTKYVPEEAKKLLVEVAGSVKLDNSDTVKKYFEVARQARADNDIANAAKYYSLIKENDPTNWEAYFYSTYYHALDCKIGQIASAVASVSNICGNTFKFIKLNIEEESERVRAGKEVVLRVHSACELMWEVAKKHYCDHRQATTAWSDLNNMAKSIQACLLNYYNHSASFFSSKEDKKFTNILVKDIQKNYIEEYNLHPSPNKDFYDAIVDLIDKAAVVIHENEPEYTSPSLVQRKTGGCYVATAVYGSYDCPQVWTLRRFRDNTLAETWYGRAFIRMYYAVSPTIVKWFGNTEWFKNLWKPTLDRLVEKLNGCGVKDTPYDDRAW